MWRRVLNRPARYCLAAALFFAAASNVSAAISVVDDTGRSVTLPAAARRIVSLAPHTTEMLFAAGAGAQVVGVTQFSDYPPQARKIPLVGSGVSLDLERILALKPDLIVGWNNGNAGRQLSLLESLGIPVFKTEPYAFETIASAIERLGRLAGTEDTGQAAAAAFRNRLQTLTARYAQRPRISVFYQVWSQPLMTLGGRHIVSAALRPCGGENIFAAQPQLAPTVSVEAVLRADPQAIIAGNRPGEDPLAAWRRFPGLAAVAHHGLLTIDDELLNRPGPRILDGTEALCKALDTVRRER